MTAKIRTGRPPAGGEPETIKVIHVGLDADALTALEKLEAALGTGVGRGRRSIAVRRAIIRAAETP